MNGLFIVKLSQIDFLKTETKKEVQYQTCDVISELEKWKSFHMERDWQAWRCTSSVHGGLPQVLFKCMAPTTYR